jgi:hypothetical protein
MTRLALLVAAALAGSGCIVHNDSSSPPPPPCDPTVSLDWQFRNADNAVTASCATAGVSSVDVWTNGVLVGSFACTSHFGPVGLANGSNGMEVEGLDGAGVILYREQFTVNTVGCGAQVPILAEPSEGRVTVSYTFSPVNSCYAPGPSFIWVLVNDDLAGVIAADSASAPEVNDTCGVDFPITFRLASGSYTLLSTEEVIRGSTSYLPVGRNCTPTPFTVAAAATTPIAKVLSDTTAFCP